MSLQQAMKFTLAAEGKYTVDDGGPTMYGVTQSVYDAFRRSHGLPKQTVRYITMTEVADIMQSQYWVPAHCEDMPDLLGIAVFDCAYNCGVAEAIKMLQGCAGVVRDGVVGPLTIKAIDTADPVTLLHDYLEARRAFYHADKSQAEYLAGWINRVNELQVYLGMIKQ